MCKVIVSDPQGKLPRSVNQSPKGVKVRRSSRFGSLTDRETGGG